MSFDAARWNQEKLRVHLIGVAGSGMTPLAEILLDLGHEVRGSDLKPAPERIIQRGLGFSLGHAAAGIGPVDVVVASAAIPDENVEWMEAKKRGLVRLRRAEV